MLKPTERPPPSLAPRFAASITPGPPPVTTASPASANSRAVARAASYVSASPRRCAPSRRSRPRGDRSSGRAWKPARNSDAISETSLTSVVVRPAGAAGRARRSLAHSRSCGTWATSIPTTSAATVTSEATATRAASRRAARRVGARRRPRAARATSGGRARRRGTRSGARLIRLRRKPAYASARRRSESSATAAARHPARGDPSGDRPGERDPGVHPRVEAHVAQRDVGAEERDEDRELGIEPGAPRLDVVAELVGEDQQDEADARTPAPDQRVAADGEEHAEELQDEHAELEDDPDGDGERREQPPEQRPRADRARPGRFPPPARSRARDLWDPVRPSDAPAVAQGRRVPRGSRRSQEPCPIHSSPPTYSSFFHSGTVCLRVSIASRHASKAAARCGAETAITTLVSPISTGPTRWWMAT